MIRRIRAEDVVDAGDLVAAAIRPHVDENWAVRAGTLEWSVERTVEHLLAGPAKYTLYLASQSPTFIALAMSRWPEATHHELIDSIAPVAIGLANVAQTTPVDALAFHADGLTSRDGFVTNACVELLVHAHDALAGLGAAFEPPDELACVVLAAAFPHVDPNLGWPALVEATGRPSP